MIRDCLENKKVVFRKPKKENKEDKLKPMAQGSVFAMTRRVAAHATSNVVISTLRLHTFLARALIDLGLTHSFIFVAFASLLGMSIDNMDFDLCVATHLGDFVMVNKILTSFCVTIGSKR